MDAVDDFKVDLLYSHGLWIARRLDGQERAMIFEEDGISWTLVSAMDVLLIRSSTAQMGCARRRGHRRGLTIVGDGLSAGERGSGKPQRGDFEFRSTRPDLVIISHIGIFPTFRSHHPISLSTRPISSLFLKSILRKTQNGEISFLSRMNPRRGTKSVSTQKYEMSWSAKSG